ncbi:hypothetical protein L6164_029360 [Bauhinia variegata]|uniref:Uncharacterized protein n=1 Tax=Bauhinia variegata TaxID=167791 RepID=A0ACB9L921_BAUVA|nr:hypothetical protein L6164_029360 [Bauhinia variegata]
MYKKKVPSLVDLCVQKAIDNARYLGDVGETDFHLLERILPHCTLEQLRHVEKSTTGRDLTPVTDKLWKKFYEMWFGKQNTDIVVERMQKKKVNFKWFQLYEAKLKEVSEAENQAVDRIKQLYKKEDARKQSRQVRLCTKVPPSSNKRWIWHVSNLKSNIMKKAKLETLNSQEVKNLAAMKKKSIQWNNSSSSNRNIGGTSGLGSYKHTIKR